MIDWKVILINLADRYSHGFIVAYRKGGSLSRQQHKNITAYNAIVCSVLGFFKKDIVLIFTFRHFRKCVLIYLYEI